jgi:hypothetical protein
MPRVEACPACGVGVPSNVRECPDCGHLLAKSVSAVVVVVLALLLVAAFLAAFWIASAGAPVDPGI